MFPSVSKTTTGRKLALLPSSGGRRKMSKYGAFPGRDSIRPGPNILIFENTQKTDKCPSKF
jgi:hypothetical protein